MAVGFGVRLLPRLCAALLCLTVAWIHVQDQGGFPGNRTPRYVGVGYYLLEAAGLLGAVLLIAARPGRVLSEGWLLAAGVGICPLVGYLLSRGPGLPDYSEDRGNWLEPLGLASLAVEGALVILALTVVVKSSRSLLRFHRG
ncbi:hypothetical protein NGB36_10135 [Streptomyces sp. RB6PN25]|uniref:Integral membrane protein n=1 Tax=Streptomyces humicola TaxID=2953240 RepID=A0ABT1PUX7_9ACTN|nr:hypothetical protein [Streptomyces humicola]MCQ4080948.1 hypothetical protein [Streptomyces humicola]